MIKGIDLREHDATIMAVKCAVRASLARARARARARGWQGLGAGRG